MTVISLVLHVVPQRSITEKLESMKQLSKLELINVEIDVGKAEGLIEGNAAAKMIKISEP